MEFFKFFVFGIAGVSVIFWVAVITLWHTYMFPKIFSQENNRTSGLKNNENLTETQPPIMGSMVINESLPNRNKYSMKSLVLADFSGLNDLKLNKLYTLVSVCVVFASFTIITYGLHSAFPLT